LSIVAAQGRKGEPRGRGRVSVPRAGASAIRVIDRSQWLIRVVQALLPRPPTHKSDPLPLRLPDEPAAHPDRVPAGGWFFTVSDPRWDLALSFHDTITGEHSSSAPAGACS